MLGDFIVAAIGIHSTSLCNWQGVDHLYLFDQWWQPETETGGSV